MSGKLKATRPFYAVILFPGDAPPHPEHWQGLRQQGFTIEKLREEPEDSRAYWSLKINHPEWGSGMILRLKNTGPPPRELIDIDLGLTTLEKTALRDYRCPITYLAPPEAAALPQVRKRHYRIIRAIMGDQADFMHDLFSLHFWSKLELDDELAHDGELGVSSLCCFHLVNLENHQHWLHSHGLDRMGAFDFDVVGIPDHAHILSEGDLRLAIASHIIEGDLRPDGKSFCIADPGIYISLIPARDFNSAVGKKRAEELRPDHENDHDEQRVVVCEPPGKWFFRKKIRPSRFLCLDDFGHSVFHFSAAATRAMEDRARQTWPVLQRYFPLAQSHELMVLVKLGYKTFQGGMEHLWFEVHDLGPGEVDATLLNEPFDVPELTPGERKKYSLQGLSDWKIFSPAGQADPQSTVRLREFLDAADGKI